MSADLTRLRNWFCNSLEDRPSEIWQDSDSNDLIRWDEECRADTESLPTLISEQKEVNINKYTRPGVSPTTCSWMRNSHNYHISYTSSVYMLTDLQWLYSEQPGCWAPLRSSVPAAGHRLQMAANERRENKEGLPCDLENQIAATRVFS